MTPYQIPRNDCFVNGKDSLFFKLKDEERKFTENKVNYVARKIRVILIKETSFLITPI